MDTRKLPLLVDAMTEFLAKGADAPGRPVTPMPGQYADYFRPPLPSCCDRYRYPFSNAERAFVAVYLLADEVGRAGNVRWPRQFREVAIRWWIAHREALDRFASEWTQSPAQKAELMAETAWLDKDTGEAWRYVLGAMRRLARRLVDEREISYENRKKLAQRLDIGANLLLDRKFTAKQRASKQPTRFMDFDWKSQLGSEWQVAGRVLCNAVQAPTALAAYFLFRLHEQLCLEQRTDSRERALYVFLRKRLLDIQAGVDLGFLHSSEVCWGPGDDVDALVKTMVDPLTTLKCFRSVDGVNELALPEGLPASFQPFRFQECVPPDLVAMPGFAAELCGEGVDAPEAERARGLLATADRLAVMVRESLTDAMRLDQYALKVEISTQGGSVKLESLAATFSSLVARPKDVPMNGDVKARRNHLHEWFEPEFLLPKYAKRSRKTSNERRPVLLERIHAAKAACGLPVPAPDPEPKSDQPMHEPGFHWACPTCNRNEAQ